MLCYLKEHGGTQKILNKAGTLISNGYSKVLHSDGYGNFLELDPSTIVESNLYSIEDYRLSEPYLNTVKYYSFATKDFMNTKITKQVKESKYIPCKVGYYYVNVNDIMVENVSEKSTGNAYSCLNQINNIITNLENELITLKNNLDDPNFLLNRLERLARHKKCRRFSPVEQIDDYDFDED